MCKYEYESSFINGVFLVSHGVRQHCRGMSFVALVFCSVLRSTTLARTQRSRRERSEQTDDVAQWSHGDVVALDSRALQNINRSPADHDN